MCFIHYFKEEYDFKKNFISNVAAKLTVHQEHALLTSWKSLRPTIQKLMRKILNDLVKEVPKVKQIFYQTAVLDAFNRESTSENLGTLEEHIKLMIEFFDDIVNNVQDEESLSNKIRKIGQCHVILTQCSFSADIWEKLGEITMQNFSRQDAVQKTREAGKAWRILIAWVTDQLRCGFDDRTKSNSRLAVLSYDFPTRKLSLSNVEQIEEGSESGSHRNDPDVSRLQQQLEHFRFEYEPTVPF